MILNITLRQAERLALMKAPIAINDGKASISLLGLPMAFLAMARHWYIVDGLREEWNDMRYCDRIVENNRAIMKRLDHLREDQQVYLFDNTYLAARYMTRLHLGKRWFNKAA